MGAITMSTSQTLCILQARMGSTRLPGKVLKPILGEPMLAHQINRLSGVKTIDTLLVATSTEQEDDAIEQLCKQLSIPCFRGNKNDVLDRFYQAALAYRPENIVRLTGDCPLIDAEIVTQVVELHLHSHHDYTSNCNPPTLPDGLDVEVFTFKALTKAWQHSSKPSEREHVTPYIRNNTQMFSCQNFHYPTDLSQHRWTVDEEKDFEFVSAIYRHLYKNNNHFALNEILALLAERPELLEINNLISRNEGLIKSEEQDKEQGFD